MTASTSPLARAGMFSLLILSAGCAFFNPAALKPGASLAEVDKALGAPTGTYALPGGGQRFEYARGPMGKETWMLDFDAGGTLLSNQQVLTEARFNAIPVGMPSQELRLVLGRPSEQWRLSFQNQIVWSYRYESLFCKWFQVGIDTSGRVADTGYYPDPQCDSDDRRDPFP